MRATKSTAGFTLIEVLLAVVILAILTLGLMQNSAKMIRGVTDDRTRTLAATSADERIARIRVWPDYASLSATFAGTENNTPAAGWTRVTTIAQTGGSGLTDNFKRATVVVTGPGLAVPISRSATLAAP